MMRSSSFVFLLFSTLLSSFSSAHLVITYPGWRGDNLITNGTVEDTNGLAVGPNNQHPYGMQWEYPCGGMTTSTNRTKWPITGGAVGFQPGWFQGHAQSVLYVNLGEGTNPINMSLPMISQVGIIGPSNNAYPNSSVCFPQVPTPAGFHAKAGDNATIQVIMLAQHGAALYSCVDITFEDPSEVNEVNKSNCQNTSDIIFTTVFTSQGLSANAAASTAPLSASVLFASLGAALLWTFLS